MRRVALFYVFASLLDSSLCPCKQPVVSCNLWEMPLYIAREWDERKSVLACYHFDLGHPTPQDPSLPRILRPLVENGSVAVLLKWPGCCLTSHTCSHQNHLEVPLSLNAGPTPECLIYLVWVGPDKKCASALAGVAQWTEHCPANREDAGLIPGQGTCLGCRPGPQLGACKRQPISISLAHAVFLPLVLPPFPL